MGGLGHHSAHYSTEGTVRVDLMLDNWMQKLLQNAASAYLPKMESIRESRKEELIEISSKVRTEPEIVEKWFAKEIDKVTSVDISDMLSNLP